MIEDFLTELRVKRKLSVATANRYAAILSSAFRFAVARGWARANPVRNVVRAREPEKSVPYVSNADVDLLVANAGDWRFGAFVRILADTGLRRGEALRLKWQDVDLNRRVLVVHESKGKRPRTVDLTKRTLVAFRRLLKDRAPVPMNGPNLVWPEWSGRNPGGVSKRFKTAARRAGFPEMRMHDLRHAFCSRLAQSGVPLPTIRELAGHKTILTTQRYASHLPDGAGRAAVEAMERHETRGRGTRRGTSRAATS